MKAASQPGEDNTQVGREQRNRQDLGWMALLGKVVELEEGNSLLEGTLLQIVVVL